MSLHQFLSNLNAPEGRVFQTDQDQFHIYLGSRFTEKRPYLRIGNSLSADKFFINLTGFLVVSEHLLGRLHNESLSLEKDSLPVLIGPEHSINTYLTFMSDKGFPSANFTTIKMKRGKNGSYSYEFDPSDIEADLTENSNKKNTDKPSKDDPDAHFDLGMRCELRIDKTGNILALINGKIILDLERSRQKGLTYQHYLNDLSARFVNKAHSALGDDGFFIAGDKPILFSSRQLFSVGLPTDYFTALASVKADPDDLSYVLTEEGDRNFEDFLTRSIYLKRNPNLFSYHFEKIKTIYDHYPSLNSKVKTPDERPLKLGRREIRFNNSGTIEFGLIKKIPDVLLYSQDLPNPVKENQLYAENKVHIIEDPSLLPTGEYDSSRLILLHQSDKQSTFNTFSHGHQAYRLFPNIIYHLKREIRFESQISLAIDLYLTRVIHDNLNLISLPYQLLSDHLFDLLAALGQKDLIFRELIHKFIKESSKIGFPLNWAQWILLSNMLEFIRYIRDVLFSRGVTPLHKVDEVINKFIFLRDNSSVLRISDPDIKGEIASFPNNSLYLFYHTPDRRYEDQLSPLHEPLLQPHITHDPYYLITDKQRASKEIIRFVNENKKGEFLLDLNDSAKIDYQSLKERYGLYHKEKQRLAEIHDFQEHYNKLSHSQKRSTQIQIKSAWFGLNEAEKDDQLFGDLFESSHYSKKFRDFSTLTEKQAKKKKWFKFAIVTMPMILLLTITLLNVFILLFKIFDGTRDLSQKLLSYPPIHSLYVVDDIRKYTGLGTELYYDEGAFVKGLIIETVTTNKNGSLSIIKSINPLLFERSVDISFEDYGSFLNQILKNNPTDLIPEPDTIYPKTVIKLNDQIKYKVAEGENLESISITQMSRIQKSYMALLTRYHLLLSYYELELSESSKPASWKNEKSKNTQTFLDNIRYIREHSLSSRTRAYAGKLEYKGNKLSDLLKK